MLISHVKTWKNAYLASFDEIVENEFNLNIPRYVDTFEKEEVIPLVDIATNIATTNQKITQQSQLLMEMLGQLQGTSTDAQSELDAFLKDLHL